MRSTPAKWLATAVLLLAYSLALTSSLNQKTPTYDEQGFIARGVGYLRGENQSMRVGHPLGLNALNAVLLAFDPAVALPTEHPSWAEHSFHRPAELFMWEIGNDVSRIMLLSRLPSIWLGLLLLALVGRWAWAVSGRRMAGLLALSLLAFDPNMLAHMRLATTDFGLAVGTTAAAYAVWRYGKRPSWRNILIAGVAFSFLINTKFTAGLFVPLLGLILAAIWLAVWRGKIQDVTLTAVSGHIFLAFPLTAFVALWAAYGFQVGVLPADLPTLPQLGGMTLPLSHYLEQLLDIGGRLQKETPAFLLGQYANDGWWYYFPVAFALKTPLPTLLLLAGGLAYWLRQWVVGKWSPNWAWTLALLPLGYFAFALTSDINLGYRHLLPVLPFTAVFIAAALARANYELRITNYKLAIPLLLLWLLANTLWIHPHYLAFFNGLAGGPDNGWRYLVDSNLDWGQDLAGLKPWLDENGVDEVWLSYFGQGRPDYYQIPYRGLDSFPPRLTHPETRPFYPHDPAPGVYAISATTLQGVHFQNHDQYDYFRQRPSLAKIGYSIFIYEVEPRGEPVELALGGVQLDELSPADYALLGSNQPRLRWFDPGQSWLTLAGNSRWLALSETAVVAWQATLEAHYTLAAVGPTYRLYRQREAFTPPQIAPLAEFTHEQGRLTLWAVDGLPQTAVPGEPISFTTIWRVEEWMRVGDGRYRPFNIFIHGQEADSPPLTQWDGLGARGQGWRPGDWLLQRHELIAPSAASLDIWLGLYDPDSGQRWLTSEADRYQAATITITP